MIWSVGNGGRSRNGASSSSGSGVKTSGSGVKTSTPAPQQPLRHLVLQQPPSTTTPAPQGAQRTTAAATSRNHRHRHLQKPTPRWWKKERDRVEKRKNKIKIAAQDGEAEGAQPELNPHHPAAVFPSNPSSPELQPASAADGLTGFLWYVARSSI